LRGEHLRALRLHRNLAARPNLTTERQVSIFTEIGLDLQACRSKDCGESYFLKALSLAKNHIPALEGLTRTYEQKRQFEKAADTLHRLIRLHRPEKGHLAFVLSELAVQNLGRGTIGPARRAVERAVRADPTCLHAYTVLADVFVAAGRYERAIATLRSFLEQWPSHSFLALRRMEDIHYRMNNFSGYEDTLRSCIRKSPDNFYLYYSLARHLQKKHRETEALEFLRRSLDMNPLYVNSLRDAISILGAENKSSELTRQAGHFFTLFKRSRRFICPSCLERYVPVTWNCSRCGFWGAFEIRYELPAP
jgi:lipopolysaccharide biosynthesis regulator YciM